MTKKISWSAFQLPDKDWGEVKNVIDIHWCTFLCLPCVTMTVVPSGKIQRKSNIFFSPNDSQLFGMFFQQLKNCNQHGRQSAIRSGLFNTRMRSQMAWQSCKNRLDTKPAYLLTLAILKYFKLAYIGMTWGGKVEQQAERAAGNMLAKNWQDKALQVLEHMVSNIIIHLWTNCFYCLLENLQHSFLSFKIALEYLQEFNYYALHFLHGSPQKEHIRGLSCRLARGAWWPHSILHHSAFRSG